jgi:hypothetical protein
MHGRKAFAVEGGFTAMKKAGWPICKKINGKEAIISIGDLTK